ncbi:epididymal protein 13-like [Apodemus sylvaticus]|uniref:epididymal protein 13-like n=1 Tax=Apodemus sylvaticus TaxID=10129 RepID=UPI0022423EC2|nr:epididymal protein 13-like [Apodemus sylvaticus]
MDHRRTPPEFDSVVYVRECRCARRCAPVETRGFRQNIISSSTTPPLVTSAGLLSLQVLNEETSNCKEEVKPPPATTTARGLVRSSGWNFLRCAYMVITFFFVSYNKGDWCYCHYCNPDLDLRDDPCCSFQ